MQEKLMMKQAIKDAEEYSEHMKRKLLEPQIRKQESEALKARVNKEKEQKRKHEENKRLMAEHREQEKERTERLRQIRAREEQIRRERFNALRRRDFRHQIDPDVKALTDHFRERVQRIEQESRRSSPSPRSAPSSEDEFLDALPPDSPEVMEGLWANIRRALGRGKTRRRKKHHKKNKKTHRHKKKHNKTHRHKKSRGKQTRRRR